SKSLREGKALELEFFLNRKLFLGGAKCRVMRVLDNGIVGVNFVDLDRHQQIRLDKLVLEVQKRLIELRKAKRAEE
ncbi:MAG: PilZ domain-containing protein, partial [Desulfovibrionaceae bacterium]|nr:PilZ domain-containing protein [Desulfovibrionaceae bacterium]